MTINMSEWTAIKRDEKGIYYLFNKSLDNLAFGKTNNYAHSYIRKNLNESNLAVELKQKFKDKLVPIHMNLLSLDGFNDYGELEGDMLAIPTLDLYRECRGRIPYLNMWWWLATPDSTPSGCGCESVRFIDSGGHVDCVWCGSSALVVRPFFILQEPFTLTS